MFPSITSFYKEEVDESKSVSSASAQAHDKHTSSVRLIFSSIKDSLVGPVKKPEGTYTDSDDGGEKGTESVPDSFKGWTSPARKKPIRILCTTFNMANAKPEGLQHLVPRGGEGFDIFAMGFQEASFSVGSLNDEKGQSAISMVSRVRPVPSFMVDKSLSVIPRPMRVSRNLTCILTPEEEDDDDEMTADGHTRNGMQIVGSISDSKSKKAINTLKLTDPAAASLIATIDFILGEGFYLVRTK
jgi:hypothetical protein